MQGGNEWALAEFIARFRPLLLEFSRGRIPTALIPDCVDEVLEDIALRLVRVRATIGPETLPSYLVAAVRKRYRAVRRSVVRRERWYDEAAALESSTSESGEVIVHTVCAESTIVASRNHGEDPPEASSALRMLAEAIDGDLDAETRLILVWVGRAVPHRLIAQWLGKSYDATTKQIWRLCRRLERAAPTYVAALPDAAQRELGRFFRRVEHGRDVRGRHLLDEGSRRHSPRRRDNGCSARGPSIERTSCHVIRSHGIHPAVQSNGRHGRRSPSR